MRELFFLGYDRGCAGGVGCNENLSPTSFFYMFTLQTWR